MNLFEILSHDERIIVLSDEGEGCIYTWNQSLTFQCWRNEPGKEHEWNEVAIRVLWETPASFKEARQAAQDWQKE